LHEGVGRARLDEDLGLLQALEVGVGQATGSNELLGLAAGHFDFLLEVASDLSPITTTRGVWPDDALLDQFLLGQVHDLLNLQRGWRRHHPGTRKIEQRQHGDDNGQPDQQHLGLKAVGREFADRARLLLEIVVRHRVA